MYLNKWIKQNTNKATKKGGLSLLACFKITIKVKTTPNTDKGAIRIRPSELNLQKTVNWPNIWQWGGKQVKSIVFIQRQKCVVFKERLISR